MDTNIKLLTIIVDRNKTEKIIENIKPLGTHFHNVFHAKGTARNEILELLGIGEVEKSVILCTVSQSNLPAIYETLQTKFKFNQPNKGLCFTTTINTVGGPATLKVISEIELGR